MMKRYFIIHIVLPIILALFGHSGFVLAESKADDAWDLIDKGALLIDVRSKGEYQSGHIEGALNVPHEKTSELVNAIGDDTSRQVVLYCRSGRRSEIAKKALIKRGYNHIVNAGGYKELLETKPTSVPSE